MWRTADTIATLASVLATPIEPTTVTELRLISETEQALFDVVFVLGLGGDSEV
jgi:hypothetical protein